MEETRKLSPTRILRVDAPESHQGLTLQGVQSHVTSLPSRASHQGRHASPVVKSALRQSQPSPATADALQLSSRRSLSPNQQKTVTLDMDETIWVQNAAMDEMMHMPRAALVHERATRATTSEAGQQDTIVRQWVAPGIRVPSISDKPDEGRLPYDAYQDDSPPSSEFVSWRRYVEGHLKQQDEFIKVLEPRMAKLEKHLPVLMVEQDMLSRVKKLEKHLAHLEAEELHLLQTRLQHQASVVDGLQVDVATHQELWVSADARINSAPRNEDIHELEHRLKQQCDALQMRTVVAEEMLAQLHHDLQTCTGALSSADAQIRTLAQNTDGQVNMNLTHWQNVHSLCDNMQAQQEQQMSIINSLQSDKAQVADRINFLESGFSEIVHYGNRHVQQEQREQHMVLAVNKQSSRDTLNGSPSLERSSEWTPSRRDLGAGLQNGGSPRLLEDEAVSVNLDPAVQAELLKFPQFVVVDAVQKDLVKLPQLR